MPKKKKQRVFRSLLAAVRFAETFNPPSGMWQICPTEDGRGYIVVEIRMQSSTQAEETDAEGA